MSLAARLREADHLARLRESAGRRFRALGPVGVAGITLALFAVSFDLSGNRALLDEAESLIRKGLELAPNDAFILDSLGWALYRRGNLDGALVELKRAFQLRADPEIAAHLGEVLWMMGRRDEAARTWKDAAKAHPENTVLADVIKKFKP